MIFHLLVQDLPRCRRVCGSFVSETARFSSCSISPAYNQAIYIRLAAVLRSNFQCMHLRQLCMRRRQSCLPDRPRILSMHFARPKPFRFFLSPCPLLVWRGCFQKSHTTVPRRTWFAIPFETSETWRADNLAQNRDLHCYQRTRAVQAFHQNIHSPCL